MANKEGMGECVIGRILPIWAQIACLPFGGQTPSDWKPNQYANIAQGRKDPKYEQKKWKNPDFGQKFKNCSQTVTSFCEAVAELSTVTNLSSIFSSTWSSVTATISTIFTLTSSQQPESHQSSLVNRSESINDLLTRPDNAMIESYNQYDPTNLRAACFWVISK